MTTDITSPRLSIELAGDSSAPLEAYRAWINRWSYEWFGGIGDVFDHGAEWFNRARIFVATNNDSSQVPGGTSDPENFTDIQYRSQYGWGVFLNQTRMRSTTWGNSTYAAGYTYTWDLACATP